MNNAHSRRLQSARRENSSYLNTGRQSFKNTCTWDKSEGVHYYRSAFEQLQNEVCGDSDGLLRWQVTKKVVDTSGDSSIHTPGAGCAIFVLSEAGIIYLHSHERFLYHHSSMVAGKNVLAAGEICVEGGKVVWVSRKSGHYLPAAAGSRQMVKALMKLRINMTPIKWRKGL